MSNPEVLAANRRLHRKHVRDWLASGQSQNQYARAHGIHPRTFFDWCQKYGRSKKSGMPARQRDAITLVPVPSDRLVPTAQPVSAPPIAIQYGANFRILVPQGFSPDVLGKIILTLENLK